MKITAVSVFAVICSIITAFKTLQINKEYLIREKFKANDPEGFNFSSLSSVAFIAVICMIASMLCGMTGIAGGMVLGPLFLSYKMNPQVMQSTNQYITLVASLSVCIQFVMMDELNWYFCGLFGVATLFCAYVGITTVKGAIKKSGKESIISILLIICLSLALVSIPLKMFLLPGKKAVVANLT